MLMILPWAEMSSGANSLHITITLNTFVSNNDRMPSRVTSVAGTVYAEASNLGCFQEERPRHTFPTVEDRVFQGNGIRRLSQTYALFTRISSFPFVSRSTSALQSFIDSRSVTSSWRTSIPSARSSSITSTRRAVAITCSPNTIHARYSFLSTVLRRRTLEVKLFDKSMTYASRSAPATSRWDA